MRLSAKHLRCCFVLRPWIFLFFFVFLLTFHGVKAQNETGSFPDVDMFHPHFDAVEYLKSHGVIEGYPDGFFRPENPINRAEALKIILLASEIRVPDSVSSVSFLDFFPSDWFAVYVEKAKELGIVQGYDDGTFRAEQTVNLAENLKILLETNEIDVERLYPGESSEWYSKYVQYAKDKNLIEADAEIFPGEAMNRGTFSEVAYRFMVVQELALEFFDPEIVLSSSTLQLDDDINDLVDLVEGESESSLTDYDDIWAELGF